MWQIINRLLKRVLQIIDDDIIKYFSLKAKDFLNKFTKDFENNVKYRTLNTLPKGKQEHLSTL